ncbi:hypothetical protein C0J52_06105 [Blattella germanica]|nr:hypothetical protein C0J52_06105 [Blattella germanica]
MTNPFDHMLGYMADTEESLFPEFRRRVRDDSDGVDRYWNRQYYPISVPGWDTPASMRRVESAFCECLKDPRNCGVVGTKLTCSCGEEYDDDWCWNSQSQLE